MSRYGNGRVSKLVLIGAARHGAVTAQGFGNLEADGQDGIEARHRLLEDHRDLVAADMLHLEFRKRQKLSARQLDAARNPAIGLPDEAHDRQRRDALAGAGLTDDGDRLVRANAEADIAHDGMPRAIAPERPCVARDREQRRRAGSVRGGRTVDRPLIGDVSDDAHDTLASNRAGSSGCLEAFERDGLVARQLIDEAVFPIEIPLPQSRACASRRRRQEAAPVDAVR